MLLSRSADTGSVHRQRWSTFSTRILAFETMPICQLRPWLMLLPVLRPPSWNLGSTVSGRCRRKFHYVGRPRKHQFSIWNGLAISKGPKLKLLPVWVPPSLILVFAVTVLCRGTFIVSADLRNIVLAFWTATIYHLGPKLILLPVWESPTWNLG